MGAGSFASITELNDTSFPPYLIRSLLRLKPDSLPKEYLPT